MQFSELEARAKPAFPAGNNNPTVVCCHGISTKMLFLSRISQQKEVAYETVDLTLCFVFLSVAVMVIQGTVGFVKSIHGYLLKSEWKIMVHDTDGKFDRIPSVKFKGHSSDLVL